MGVRVHLSRHEFVNVLLLLSGLPLSSFSSSIGYAVPVAPQGQTPSPANVKQVSATAFRQRKVGIYHPYVLTVHSGKF